MTDPLMLPINRAQSGFPYSIYSVSALVNAALARVRSLFLGATEPPAVAGQPWLDSAATEWMLRLYGGTNWLPLIGITPGTNGVRLASGVTAHDPATGDASGLIPTTAWVAALAGGKLPLTGGALSGALNLAKAADVTAAATTDIGGASGNYVTITGSATISALGTAPAGAMRLCRFGGACTLVHHGAALVLPNGVNLVTIRQSD